MDNRVKEAFGQLHADDALKNNTKAYIYQKTDGYRKKSTPIPGRLAVVMACFLLAVFGWRGYSDFFTSVSTISIDVNPSFELDINRFDKVISVHAYNDGGAAILSAASIRFLDYRKAMDVLLQNENMAQYLSDEQPVEVTVFGANEQKSSEMLENLNSCTATHGNVQCVVGDSSEAAKAHALGLSYGKYRAFLELQALDPSVTADDIRGLTMRQIRDMIRERAEEPKATDESSENSKDDSSKSGNSDHSDNENHSGKSTGDGNRNGNCSNSGDGSGNGFSNRNSSGSGSGNANGKDKSSKNGNGSGSGSSSGNNGSSSSGNGNGNGKGSSSGSGNGNGSGHGFGNNGSSGSGNGNGNGKGNSSGSGNGNGSGHGRGHSDDHGHGQGQGRGKW